MAKISRRFFIFGGLATLALASGWSWSLYKKFGALPETPPLSPNWQNGEFQNLPDHYIYSGLDSEPGASGGWLKFFLERDGNRYPPGPVPAAKADLHSLRDGEFVWFGHSSFLLRLCGKFICIDPVLSSRASPVPFTIPAWHGSSPYKAPDFPVIDYLCISHDHWDHLDYDTVKNLSIRKAICGKGTGAHFRAWGLAAPVELDWWEEFGDGPLRFTFTPSRHFSGRGLTRNQSLWGGFAIKAPDWRIYFSGDGGYGSHFQEIGKKLGPFDIAFTDSGQYNRAWPYVHMFPEQSVQACQEVRTRLACPCHFGKFTLAWHPWNEPAQRFSRQAEASGVPYMLPVIGEKYSLD